MSQHLLDKVKLAFRPRPIDPDTPHDLIMYEAGANAVVQWLINEVEQTQRTPHEGAPDHTAVPDIRQRFNQALRGRT